MFHCLCLCLALLPQEVPKDPARELLARAVAIQTPGGKAPVIEDFQADLTVSLFDHDRGGAPTSAIVTEYFRRKGSAKQYHRILNLPAEKKTTHLMTDGRICALWEEGGAVHDLLQAPELADDLKQLREERARTEEMLEIFFLANLDGPQVRWTMGTPRPPLREDSGKEISVLDLLRVAEGDDRTMTISIGKDDGRVYEVRLVRGKRDELFRFGFHEEIQKKLAEGGTQRLLIPKRVDYLENGKIVMTAAALEASRIKFNVGLSDKVFQPPARNPK